MLCRLCRYDHILSFIKMRLSYLSFCVLGAGLLGIPNSQISAQNQITVPAFDFQGRYLVVASDTDMLPSAYIDGKLGPMAGPDELSVIRLDRSPAAMKPITVEVTNSVIGPPSSIALTPDGRYAIVIETQGPRPSELPDAKLSDLPLGRTITVVDLSDLDHPKVVQKIKGFDSPLSVSINADGTLVAVVFKKTPQRKQPLLAMYRLQQGKLSKPFLPSIPGSEAGDALVSAEFHPKKNVLGLVYTEHPRLSLFQVDATSKAVVLSSWGDPVNLDIAPFLVRFTPDGRFAIVNAMLLGTDIRGTVSSIRLEQSAAADGTPHHLLVSRADTGVMPEGLAISPNQHWIATTNLERSAQPLDDPKQGFFSSVSLLRLDPQTGSIDRVGEFPFDGMLPESAVFDNTSRFLAVVCFAHFDRSKPNGSVDFWRLTGDFADPKRTELVKTDFSITVARGPQSMVIAR